MQAEGAHCAPLARKIGLGLAGALLAALIAGCETVSLDEPSETGAAPAARSDEPGIVS